MMMSTAGGARQGILSHAFKDKAGLYNAYMDCPIGTVRSRIFRAREAIDAELRPLVDVERPAERATR